MNVILEDLHTAIEWQCAHAALEHGEKGRQITLTYDTPDGDLTLFVIFDGVSAWISKKNPNQGTAVPVKTTEG